MRNRQRVLEARVRAGAYFAQQVGFDHPDNREEEPAFAQRFLALLNRLRRQEPLPPAGVGAAGPAPPPPPPPRPVIEDEDLYMEPVPYGHDDDDDDDDQVPPRSPVASHTRSKTRPETQFFSLP